MGIPVYTQVVSGVVLKKDGKYLLLQEKQPQAYKKWNWPAGKVDQGETIEQAAVREAKEESGLTVELVRKIGIWQAQIPEPAKHAFEGKIISGELHFPADEVLDAQWFTIDEIRAMKDQLRTEWVLEAAELMEKGL